MRSRSASRSRRSSRRRWRRPPNVYTPTQKEHPVATQVSNAAATAQPVAPDTIDPRTALDHVHLIVRSLDRVLPFYTDVLGFQVHRREERPDGRFAALGAG